MLLLLDECVDVRLLALLIAYGHDVTSLAHLGRFVMKDTDVLAAAGSDKRVVISADRDFARTVFWRRPRHSGFLYLGTTTNPEAQADQVDRLIREHEAEMAGFTWLTDGGVRFSASAHPERPAIAPPPLPRTTLTRKKHDRRRK